MRRVIFNEKGGVGKSSITCNLAAIGASLGRKVLVIDLDPQCNSTQYLLGTDDQPDITAKEYFEEQLSFTLLAKRPTDFVIRTAYPNLSIIASHPNLMEIESKLQAKNKIYKLRDLLNRLDAEFDDIYIDTAPALNFFTNSALIAADNCLIPFDCDAFSRTALYGIMEVTQEIRMDHNENLQIEGIVVNQFQPRASLPQQLIDEMTRENLPLIPVYLNHSVKMRESHHACSPLIHYAPSHKLTQQYVALYNHLN